MIHILQITILWPSKELCLIQTNKHQLCFCKEKTWLELISFKLVTLDSTTLKKGNWIFMWQLSVLWKKIESLYHDWVNIHNYSKYWFFIPFQTRVLFLYLLKGLWQDFNFERGLLEKRGVTSGLQYLQKTPKNQQRKNKLKSEIFNSKKSL